MAKQIAIMASGAGTTLDFLLHAQREQRLKHQIRLLVTNSSKSESLQVANRHHIKSVVARVEAEILQALTDNKIEMIFLAGYLKKIGPQVLQKYKGKIFNSHPSLLPKYGGKGMYGSRVTEAVLAAKENETGVTIHLVDENYDSGQIMVQERIAITADDTAATLEARVKSHEKKLILNFLNSL